MRGNFILVECQLIVHYRSSSFSYLGLDFEVYMCFVLSQRLSYNKYIYYQGAGKCYNSINNTHLYLQCRSFFRNSQLFSFSANQQVATSQINHIYPKLPRTSCLQHKSFSISTQRNSTPFALLFHCHRYSIPSKNHVKTV